MKLPYWITQEEMYNLNNSKDARNWMLHDFLVFRFSGKYTRNEIMRKLRISVYGYHRLSKKMEKLLRNYEENKE